MKKPFRFKLFSIDDSNCAMKVGTDSILLGSWVKAELPSTILDIGAGSGLLSLMMAQKHPSAAITAIEIEDKAAEQCKLNFDNSPFENKLLVIKSDFLRYRFKQKYDLIISNPPYFGEGVNSINLPKNLARKSEFLPLESFIQKAVYLLNPSGKLMLILPFHRMKLLEGVVRLSNFNITKQCQVYSKSDSAIKLIMFEISKGENHTQEKLVIYSKTNEYTKQFKELTQDFYL